MHVCVWKMSNCYETVSLNSFLLSRVGQDSKISILSIMGPRKQFYKVQYVLELIKKMKDKNPGFGTAKWRVLLQGSVPSVTCNKGVLNRPYWQRERAGWRKAIKNSGFLWLKEDKIHRKPSYNTWPPKLYLENGHGFSVYAQLACTRRA